MAESTAMALGRGEGRSVGAVGTSVVLKAGAEDTDGGWMLFEYTAPPGFTGPPPHWHKTFSEGLCVLEGTIRFELDGESVDAEAGSFGRVPGSSTASPIGPTGRRACWH
jgi:mannose-6-phosphate isomerase-like protein (cupin superfamily)